MQTLPLDDLWFNLELCVSCGQAFRWRKYGNTWYTPSPHGDPTVWKVRQTNDIIEYEGVSEMDLIHYFSLDHNLEDILFHINRDPLINDAITRCHGLRIMRQNPWECLISYICSSCANIPSIKMRVEKLAEKYGTKIFCDNKIFFSFPLPETIASTSVRDIRSCKVGYRDRYIHGAADMASKNPKWQEKIHNLPYQKAYEKLLELNGVGPKIADCVLLFGFEKFEAAPIDTWIERILRTKYIGGTKKLPYAKARTYIQEHFGKFAGYAQEYLFASRNIIMSSEKIDKYY